MTTFSLHSFTRAPSAPGWEVLRIDGRWQADAPEQLPEPWLLVDDGRRGLHVTPAPPVAPPSADPSGSRWVASFPLPSDLLVSGRLAYALRCGDHVTIDLPRPIPGTPDATAASAAAGIKADAPITPATHTSPASPPRTEETARELEALKAQVRSAQARARAAERALGATRAALALAEEDRLEFMRTRGTDQT